MQRGIKKPPITLEELEERQKSKAEPGPLLYQGGGPKEDRKNEKSKKLRNKDVIKSVISILAAVAISSLLMYNFTLPKKDIMAIQTFTKDVDSGVASVREKINGETKRLDTIINTMGTYAKKEDLRPLASKASLDESIVDLKESIPTERYGYDLTYTTNSDSINITVVSNVGGSYLLQGTIVFKELKEVGLFDIGMPVDYIPQLVPYWDRWLLAGFTFYKGPYILDKNVEYSTEIWLDPKINEFGRFDLYLDLLKGG